MCKLQHESDVQAVNGIYKRGSHSLRPPPFTGDWSNTLPVRRQDDSVCETEACKSFADSVIAGRAKNYTDVDPCTDFAAYTCANWWDTHDFRADQSSKFMGSAKGVRIPIANWHRYWCFVHHV
jgi:endothelin-converting enzyme